ncbi:class I SAM-dependent DNA methyltransferase [Gemmatimonas sp.]|uniref:class I SAM-dependent DNA methyltransferase n=1 Tax=Gemmatimonas sp. TaxID=1962908 RepID=UPI003F6EF911
MTSPSATSPEITLRALRDRWADTKAAERANAQSYLRELCEALGVPTPQPAGSGYEFELPVKLITRDGTEANGFIDCYKAGHFILEAKDVAGGASDVALRRAYGQARQYAAHDPSGSAPPYLLVLDVAKTLLVYHRWGGTYQGFAAGHRIDLASLDQRRADIDLLRDIWTAPAKRDPRQHAQAVTQEIATKLAALAAALEGRGFEPERVARFLMRVVFSCFAEDVDLLPRDAFRQTVQRAGVEGDPVKFQRALETLWHAMDEGGMFGFESLLRFNGHFFKDAEALPLEKADIVLVLEAAKADWKDVEPTIFGTLLTRALDPVERHRLGAEYTPRAFIERLVRPTVEEPVRERWTAVQVEVLQLRETGKPKDRAAAEQRLRDFLEWMQRLRVLDPACGSGNFLYVTMHVLKDIEYEVVRALEALTGHQELRMQEIGPANFFGIEVKPWAREIAELTLWIGFHQYWKQHHAVQPPEPVLADTGTLELRDAVLAWDRAVVDPSRSTLDPTPRLIHPVTGELVPDPTARRPYVAYHGATPATWPDAEFIVGNPPYLGAKRMRDALGDGYVEALRAAYPTVADTTDFVGYWWRTAAQAVARGTAMRAGLITTNSITQVHQRGVITEAREAGAQVVWAAPDHPWVDEKDGAAVRVALTVLAANTSTASFVAVDETGAVRSTLRVPRLNDDLTPHADVAGAVRVPLMANKGLASMGFALHGHGFVVQGDEARHILARSPATATVLKPYRAGRDMTTRPRDTYVIDFAYMEEAEARAFPLVFDIVRDRVKPERDANRRDVLQQFWWRFGWPRREMREALQGLTRYIVTTETTKYRAFHFLDAGVAADHGIVCIASDASWVLGVLSSQIHVQWSLAAGSRLGVGNDPRYTKTACFDPFPFPEATPEQRQKIGALGDQVVAHRSAALQASDKVTITKLYNVIEKLRTDAPLTAADLEIHRLAACGSLRDLHDALGVAVAEAYGWSWPEPPALILERLVALHDRRVEEEAAGTVRWLRPDYQRPRFNGAGEAAATAPTLDLTDAPSVVLAAATPWPADAIGQITVLRSMAAITPVSIEEAVQRLVGAKREIVGRHLETLAMLGEVRDVGGGRYAVAAGV